jgi:hypothetical protein
MPVILATQEAEITVPGQQEEKFEPLSEKQN